MLRFSLSHPANIAAIVNPTIEAIKIHRIPEFIKNYFKVSNNPKLKNENVNFKFSELFLFTKIQVE
jgi:hypothetical protein